MIPVRYVQYSFGRHRIFYVAEGGADLDSPPTVHCYFPDKDSKLIVELKRIDVGIYHFEISFKIQGNHLFVYYEGDQKTGILNAIARPY